MAPAITKKVFAAGSECPAGSPDKLRLYSMRFCPFAQRPRLVLDYKGIDYEEVNIHLKSKPEWYTAKVPTALVPAVQLGDQLLWESVIVCDWLDEVYPANRLTPSDPYRKAKDRLLFESYSSMVGSFYILNQIRAGDEEQASRNLLQRLGELDRDLSQRGSTFFGGDQPAMVDLLMWPHFERFPAQLVPFEPRAALSKENFPQLASWVGAMKQLPAVQASMFDVSIHKQHFANIRAKTPNYDLGLANDE